MGLPERLLERQLRRLKGSPSEKLRQARRANTWLLVAVTLNGLAAAINLLVRISVPWSVLGVLFLLTAYVALRQRRYLKTWDGNP